MSGTRYIRMLSTVLITAALLLPGCGGGGSGPAPASPTTPTTPTDPTPPTTPTDPPPTTPTDPTPPTTPPDPPPTTPVTGSAKGFWSGSDGTSVILLANGDAWLVFQEAGTVNRFARIRTSSQQLTLSGSGTLYRLQLGSSEAVSLTGSFVEKQRLTASVSSTSGSSALALTYDARYETRAGMNDVAGSWSGSYGGVNRLTLNVATTGVLTGSSTAGCGYSGSVQPRTADPAVFDISFTETCVVGTPVTLAGIATVNSAKTGISFAVTTADLSKGALFTGQRP